MKRHSAAKLTKAAQDTKHTPGPWSVNVTRMNYAVVRWHIASSKYGSVYPICEHQIEQEPSGDEQLANARLIAAAPELLEALLLAREVVANSPKSLAYYLTHLPRIDAAIAKAKP